MTVKDIFRSMCNGRGISFSQAAENIGISKGALWNRMSNNDGMNVKLENLIRYFGEMECEIYVVDSLTEEEWLLDGEDECVELDRKKCLEEW